jgi:hypothetical protein
MLSPRELFARGKEEGFVEAKRLCCTWMHGEGVSQETSHSPADATGVCGHVRDKARIFCRVERAIPHNKTGCLPKHIPDVPWVLSFGPLREDEGDAGVWPGNANFLETALVCVIRRGLCLL